MKVGIYCRLSEEDRTKQTKTDDSESIQNQKSMLLQYAFDRDWEVYSIYSDDDYTGSDRNRPEFNRLLKDAENRKIDIVLCKTQSRFTREMELVEKYIHGYFPIWGIRFVSVVDNADTDNKGNKKARQINGLVNEWYLEEMSDNIKSVLTSRREQGFHIGAFSLYGYLKDPNQKGHLIIDEEAATTVRRVFDLYTEGYGKTSIARLLNAEGIPNPTAYKKSLGIRQNTPNDSNAFLWKYYTISDMLRNEMYIGNMVQGKYGSISYKSKRNKPKPKSQWIRVEDTHLPIIEKDVWDKVQIKLDSNYKPFSVNGKVGLFAKKVKCLECGYNMRSSKTKDRYYLKCTTNHVEKSACTGSFISVKLLESTVITELNNLINQYVDMDFLDQNIRWNENFSEQKNSFQLQINSYISKREEYSKAIQELYLDKVKRIITEEDFVLMSKDFYEKRNSLDQLIGEIQYKISDLESKKTDFTDKKKLLAKYTHVESLSREIVEELIDYIEVGKKNPKTKEQKIIIYWNF